MRKTLARKDQEDGAEEERTKDQDEGVPETRREGVERRGGGDGELDRAGGGTEDGEVRGVGEHLAEVRTAGEGRGGAERSAEVKRGWGKERKAGPPELTWFYRAGAARNRGPGIGVYFPVYQRGKNFLY